MKTIPMSFLYNNLRLCIVLLSSFTATILFSAKADPCTHNTKYEGGETATSNRISDIANGYNYELWQQNTETGSMTVYGGDADCAFKANWDDSGDFIALVGYFDLEATLNYTKLGNITAEYNHIKNGTAGEYSYIGVHGWTKNPLLEYYIVEDSFTPDGEGMYYETTELGSYSLDGATYTLYKGDRFNHPCIEGQKNFSQIYAVRSEFRTCGHVSVSEHFKIWEELGIKLGNIYDCKINCETGGGKGSIDFTFATMSWNGQPGHITEGDSTGSIITTASEYPLNYDKENTGADCADPATLDINNLKSCTSLPNPFEWADGSGLVTKFSDWACRRNEIKREIEHWEIGEKPAFDKLEADYTDGTLTVKVYNGQNSLTLTSNLYIPTTAGTYPVVICIDENTEEFSSSIFNNCLIVPFSHKQITGYYSDGGRSENDPFYQLYPGTFDTKTGFCAWSWGVSRLIDGLYLLKDKLNINIKRIAVTGRSCSGKIALYAGALDERIALTITQESGDGSLNSWRAGEEYNNGEDYTFSEGYDWYLKRFESTFKGQIDKVPYDHHELIAMIAPRAFLGLFNSGFDPAGAEASYTGMKGAEEVWKAMDIEDRFGYVIDNNMQCSSVGSNQNTAQTKFIKKFLYDDSTINTNIKSSTIKTDQSHWIKAWSGHKITNEDDGTSEIIDKSGDIYTYSLSQNVPNPVIDGETSITYSLGDEGYVILSLYNTLGVKIMDIVNGQKSEGVHTATINVNSLPSGIYHYVMNVNGYTLRNSIIIKQKR